MKLLKNNTTNSIVNISWVQLYFGPCPEIFIKLLKNDAKHDYLVGYIMGHKVINRVDYYYTHWKEYLVENNSWEPIINLALETLKIWNNSRKTR